MSWLSEIANGLGSVFGEGNNWGDQLGDYIASSKLGSVFGSDPGGKGNGIFGSDLWGPVISAGTQLAGTYFGQKDQRRLAEQYAEMKKAELEAAKAQGGAANALAKKKMMSDLYADWARATSEAGQAQAKLANDAAGNITAPINIRAGRL